MDFRARLDKGSMMTDIHAQIANEAAQCRNARPSVQDAKKTPALSALLDSARKALEQSIPPSFEHEGRVCFLRAALPMARLIIFDNPKTLKPMIFAMSGSSDEFGHDPFEHRGSCKAA